jgi:hypothetical protein
METKMAEANTTLAINETEALEGACAAVAAEEERSRSAAKRGVSRKAPGEANAVSCDADAPYTPVGPNEGRTALPKVGPTKAREPQVAMGVETAKKSAATETKAAIVLKKLKSVRGVTIRAIMEATGWQAHTVRGFLSAVVREKLGLNLVSDPGKDEVRCYRIVATGEGA